MIKNLSKNKKGFTLVEMVIYMGLLALLVVVVITMLVSIVKSQRNIKSHLAIEETVVVSLDRMIREIRNAKSVDISSILGTNPGHLILNTTDSGGNPKTVEFYLESGVLKMEENTVVSGPLSRSDVTISSLMFWLIDNQKADAVRITMTVNANQPDGSVHTENFYATAILRGSY